MEEDVVSCEVILRRGKRSVQLEMEVTADSVIDDLSGKQILDAMYFAVLDLNRSRSPLTTVELLDLMG